MVSTSLLPLTQFSARCAPFPLLSFLPHMLWPLSPWSQSWQKWFVEGMIFLVRRIMKNINGEMTYILVPYMFVNVKAVWIAGRRHTVGAVRTRWLICLPRESLNPCLITSNWASKFLTGLLYYPNFLFLRNRYTQLHIKVKVKGQTLVTAPLCRHGPPQRR